MKKYLLRAGLLLPLGLCLSANLYAQDMLQVRKWIDTLASKTMLGRGYVGQGDKKAANFLAQEYAKIGLKTLNYRPNYFQYFGFSINTFPQNVKLKVGKKRLEVGQNFIVNAISKQGKGRAKIVYLDSATIHNDSLRNNFLGQKFHKKAIVYDLKHYKKLTQYTALVAKLHECKALVELQNRKLIASVASKPLSQPIFEVPENQWDTSAKKLRFRVDAQWIERYVSQNVIGFVEGSTEPDSFLVVTAHYDHLGMMGKKAMFRGAHDNASGVAMLLSLAQYYAQNKPKYSIVFMAFGAEELGLLGSKYYVNNPLFPLNKIKFLLNLDMISTGEDGIMVVNGAIFQREFEQLQKINQAKNYFKSIQKRGFAANSDHYFFTENGVRAFYIYTLGTSLKAYHDIDDLPQNLPLTKYKELYECIIDFFQQI